MEPIYLLSPTKRMVKPGLFLIACFFEAGLIMGRTSDSVERLAPHVVVSTRTNLPPEKTSPAVAYISEASIERNQDQDLTDILRRQTGVVINTSGTKGSLSSLFLRGTNSDHTGFFIDGRRLNPGFGNQYSLEFIPISNLGSVRLQKGASSVNYGASGIGGVVDLQTRLPSEGSDSFIKGEFGSNEFRRFQFSTGYFEEDRSLNFGGHFLETENQRANDEYQSKSLNARLEQKMNRYMRFELIGFFVQTDKGLPNTITTPRDHDSQDAKLWLISPGVRYKNDDWSGQFFYSRSESKLDSRNFRSSFTPPFPSGLVDSENYVRSDELYLQLNYRGAEDTAISSGLLYRNDEAFNGNLDSFIFGAPKRSFRGRYEQAGIWAQLRWELNDAFELRFGGRYDEYSDFDSSYIGNFEMLYHLDTLDLSLFLKLADSYAPPSPGDIAFDADPVGTALNPEKSVSYELGFRQILLKEKLEITGVAFRNEIDDLIGFMGFDAFNVNRAVTEGIELNIQCRPTQKLDFSLGYTYLTALDKETDIRLLRRPRHILQFGAYYTASENLRFGLIGNGYYEREEFSFTSNSGQFDHEDYFVFNLLVDWQVSENWSLSARVENLTDKSYESVFEYPSLGRTGYIGAKFHF